jgi:hypothetical protein
VEGVSFSGAEILIITGLLAAVTAPLALMYRRSESVNAMLLADKDRQIARLETQNENLMTIALTGSKAAETVTTVLKTQRGSR